MNDSNQARTIGLGALGAVIGGCAGYFVFFWIVRQGFYALVIPGALLGLGAGLCARRRSVALAVACAAAGLGLGLYTEWRFEPFIADSSLSYFVAHLQALKPITYVMVGLGAFLSYRFALGRDPGPSASGNSR